MHVSALVVAANGTGAYPNPGVPITGGFAKGSTTLQVADTTRFIAGGIVLISQDEDTTLPVLHVSGGNGARSQTAKVVSIGKDSIDIFPSLYWSLKSNLKPAIKIARFQATVVGIEDLKIDATNAKAPRNIDFIQTIGCWIKNVHSYQASNFHFYIENSLQCEIRHSNLDSLKNEGSNGGGLLVQHTSASLFEDNIIFKCVPQIEINFGSSGNVFAYNFCENNYVYGIMGGAINANHGPHNHYNLFEGNVASQFQSDGYFGSASENTLFRNWFHGTCDTSQPTSDKNGKCIDLCRFSRNFSIVGNVLGLKGYEFVVDPGLAQATYEKRYIYRFGAPNMGNGGYVGTAEPSAGVYWSSWLDRALGIFSGAPGFQELDLDVRKTTLVIGNYNTQTNGIPSSETIRSGESLPNSLYLTGKPKWFGSLAWPAFNPLAPNLRYDAIPAGYRFVHGQEAPMATNGGEEVAAKAPTNVQVTIKVN